VTTKQIAQAVNKDITTVQRWIKRLDGKMQSIDGKMQSSTSARPADFDLVETCAIIEIGLGKNAADLYRMNARGIPASQSALTEKDIEFIAKLTAGIVSQIMSNLDQRMHHIESRIDQRQALLPAPQIEPKQAVNKLVREYVAHAGIDYRAAWGELYREFGYRTRTDPNRAARNRGMAIIDYIEAEGQIDTLLAVAIDLWRVAA
jgi:hypothetical protein